MPVAYARLPTHGLDLDQETQLAGYSNAPRKTSPRFLPRTFSFENLLTHKKLLFLIISVIFIISWNSIFYPLVKIYALNSGKDIQIMNLMTKIGTLENRIYTIKQDQQNLVKSIQATGQKISDSSPLLTNFQEKNQAQFTQMSTDINNLNDKFHQFKTLQSNLTQTFLDQLYLFGQEISELKTDMEKDLKQIMQDHNAAMNRMSDTLEVIEEEEAILAASNNGTKTVNSFDFYDDDDGDRTDAINQVSTSNFEPEDQSATDFNDPNSWAQQQESLQHVNEYMDTIDQIESQILHEVNTTDFKQEEEMILEELKDFETNSAVVDLNPEFYWVGVVANHRDTKYRYPYPYAENSLI